MNKILSLGKLSIMKENEFYFKIPNKDVPLYYDTIISLAKELNPNPEINENKFDTHIGMSMKFKDLEQRKQFKEQLAQHNINFIGTLGY